MSILLCREILMMTCPGRWPPNCCQAPPLLILISSMTVRITSRLCCRWACWGSALPSVMLASRHASYELSSRYFVVERSGSEPVNTVFYFLWWEALAWICRIPAKNGWARRQWAVQSAKTIFLTDKDLWLKILWCIFGRELQYWVDWPGAIAQLTDVQGRARHQAGRS